MARMGDAGGFWFVSITRTLAAFAGYGLLAAASLAAPQSAQASPAVALDSAIFVERLDQGARRLEPVRELNRGDRVVYVVTWQRSIGSGPFTVTNPLPRQVYFQGSANGDEQVSVDGGRSWGRIGELRSGARLATPEDVTHVRWRVSAELAARGSGRIAYSAIVR
jgi:hypothetical protein